MKIHLWLSRIQNIELRYLNVFITKIKIYIYSELTYLFIDVFQKEIQ